MENEKVVQEETKIEEISAAQEEKPQEAIEEEKPVEQTDPTFDEQELQAIEDKRKIFLKDYRSGNRIKSIMFFVVMFLMVGTFIIVPTVGDGASWQLPTMIGIAVALLAGVLAFSYLTRKKIMQKMRDYFSAYYGNLNDFVFMDKSYDKVLFENPGKIEDHLFLDSGLYKDVFEVRSRGATTYEFEHKQMLVCDCAGSVKAYKRVQPIYVGKYIVTGNKYDGKEPIFIYIKGDERALPPTNLEEVKVVFDDKHMTIYSNDPKWDSFVTSKLHKQFASLKPNKELVDIAIAIQPGTSYFALGYDDPLMVVPLDKPLNAEPIKIYKKDLLTICKLAKELD